MVGWCKMSDEEKQAIKDCDNIFICLDDAMSEDSANYYRKSYKILKNLIDKQQKEIEELKEINEEIGKALDEWINGERTSIFHIHKDKIKAKIEELEKNFPVTITKEELEKIWKE